MWTRINDVDRLKNVKGVFLILFFDMPHLAEYDCTSDYFLIRPVDIHLNQFDVTDLRKIKLNRSVVTYYCLIKGKPRKKRDQMPTISNDHGIHCNEDCDCKYYEKLIEVEGSPGIRVDRAPYGIGRKLTEKI
jgi:hypothetical protein